jgi:hypothetical protein
MELLSDRTWLRHSDAEACCQMTNEEAAQVTQIFNLPYRRIVFARAQRFADWKSATQQIDNLRYESRFEA